MVGRPAAAPAWKSLDPHGAHVDAVVGAVVELDTLFHRPRNHLVVQRDVRDVLVRQHERLFDQRIAIFLIDLLLDALDQRVHLRVAVASDVVIAIALRTPTHHAEDLKIKYACALTQLANPEETIEVPSVGERPPRRLVRQTLAEVVEPSYEELFSLVLAELKRSGFESVIAAGIVLTGGGAKMDGAIELAEEVFNMPVRLGTPQYVSGLIDVVRNPIYATGVGLLLFGSEASRNSAHRGRIETSAGLWERMKNWFHGNF